MNTFNCMVLIYWLKNEMFLFTFKTFPCDKKQTMYAKAMFNVLGCLFIFS